MTISAERSLYLHQRGKQSNILDYLHQRCKQYNILDADELSNAWAELCDKWFLQVFQSFNIIQAPSKARGLGMKNWKKEIVCIMRVCDRGGKIPVVCPSVRMSPISSQLCEAYGLKLSGVVGDTYGSA